VGTRVILVEQAVAAVQMTPPSYQVFEGDSFRVTARALDSGGVAVSHARLSWASSDPSIVQVDSLGSAVANATGWVTIEAVSGNDTGAAPVEVRYVTLVGAGDIAS